MTRRSAALAAIEAVVGINAVGGMVYAVAGAKDVPIEWLDGSPFRDYRMPGIVLGTVVGGTNLAAAAAVAKSHPAARRVSLTAAAVTAGWIAAQFAIIGYRSPLQPAIVGTSLATAYLALAG